MERQEIRYESEFSEVGHTRSVPRQITNLGKDLQRPPRLGLGDLRASPGPRRKGIQSPLVGVLTEHVSAPLRSLIPELLAFHSKKHAPHRMVWVWGVF